MTEFNFDAFRKALGAFATRVTVVTARTDSGENVGVKANGFNSVSLNPPLVLWSLNKESDPLGVFQQVERFAVNVLASGQVELANLFASAASTNGFRDVPFTEVAGTPVIANCAADFQCHRYSVYEGGDHLIIVGRVESFNVSSRSGLVYHRGEYSVSQAYPPVSASERGDTVAPGGFVQDYLPALLHKAANGYATNFSEQILGPSGLNHPEWRIMVWLADQSTGMQLSDLPTAVALEKATVVTILTQLQDRGWVKCIQDLTSPERTERYSLTSAGLELMVPLIAAARDYESVALARLSPEDARQLKEQLKALIQWSRDRRYELPRQSDIDPRPVT